MQGISQEKYFRFVIFMLMATTFLPLVFNNLPPLIRSHHLWAAIWGVSILFFYPRVLSSKLMLLVIGYGLFLFISLNTFWVDMDEWNRSMLITELYNIAIGVSVFTYFQSTNDYLSFAKITKWALIFIGITAIMTIISSAIDPMYARNLIGVGSLDIESEKEVILGFKRLGGGTYGTAAVFMCLFPILIYYYKNIKLSLLSKKEIIVFLIIIFFALIGMQIFANILIAIIFGFIAIFGARQMKKTILILCAIVLIAVFIPKSTYVNALMNTSDLFEKQSELNYKFMDMAIFIETGGDIEDNTTGTGGRAERYPILFEAFIKSPLMGCYFLSDNRGNGYKEEGAHLYWMNKLTITGIIGLLIFICIPFKFIRNNLLHFVSSYRIIYFFASISILILGVMKAIVGRETWYAFFVIIPGMYYLPLLMKRKSIKNNFNNQQDSSLEKSIN